METIVQLALTDLEVKRPGSQTTLREGRAGTFADNMQLPIHKWFRYSAGFSSEWVEKEITERVGGLEGIVLDPFVGSGTTVLAAEKVGIPSQGLEAHSFMRRIARAKTLWHNDPQVFVNRVRRIVEEANGRWEATDVSECSPTLKKSYTEENLKKLEAIRLSYIKQLRGSVNDDVSELVWLAITSILRVTSSVGTAQWQYLLPNKTKKRVLNPFEALTQKALLMALDMQQAQEEGYHNNGDIIEGDARTIIGVEPNSVSLVITSPPYPNNYDYADATRLELTYWREVDDWRDLHEHIRKHLLRSCSQHTAKDKLVLETLLEHYAIEPIRGDLQNVCDELGEVRKTKKGRKSYHTMIAAYFIDLALTWHALRRVCQEGAEVCFVIGDSAPYGVYVPVDKWLGELALASGFQSYQFDKLRDRNIKWKNRKHRVLLKEGNLWVRG